MFEPDYVTYQYDGITISACQSLIDEDGVCGYYLKIENDSSEKIQLIGKDFKITDSKGNLYTDLSMGFKGELPELEPGEYFEFENKACFHDCSAVLYGSCRIIRSNKKQTQDIKIPALELFLNEPVSSTLN